jgi:hypothetical protein
MIGLVYTDESEASSFMKVVTKKRSALGKSYTCRLKCSCLRYSALLPFLLVCLIGFSWVHD